MKRKAGRRQVVRDEFGGVDLGDERRSRRAKHIADRLAATPDASLPEAMGDRAGIEALYRHLESDDVTGEALLGPHLARTAERVHRAGVALAISDTTAFKFGGDRDRDGLGPVNKTDQGFLAHVTLAVAADGTRTPLGILAVESWARPEGKKTKRPVSESSRWWRGMAAAEQRIAGASLIHVADREGDIYTLLGELSASGHRFIIRYPLHRPRLARVTRARQAAGDGRSRDMGEAGGGVEGERALVARVLCWERVHGGRAASLGVPARAR